METNAVSLVYKLLDLGVGTVTILAIVLRWKGSGSTNATIKDLIREIEEKDELIERLKIQKHAAELRHEHATNKANRQGLHLS